MKIVVIGGTGLIGSKVVRNLIARGHDAMAAAPSTGVDTITGAGLGDALAGADVVVDLANSPSFEEAAVKAFFEASGRNLFAAERTAGVRHHVALSVVGTDRLQQSAYFRGKIIQENLIRAAGVPYTIVRSTQFFEFVGAIAQAGAQGDTVRLTTAHFQPIASDDVAAAVTDFALDAPRNGIAEIGGPERVRIADLVERFLSATHDARTVTRDANADYFGAVLQDDTLVPAPGARLGATTFDAWCRQNALTR
ncbi:SDR family oxidoreductase [Burkholderia orbicola]|uniref:SDR family oxidoreductase n=1 Tax=Burkholderia orbicola TaxID=2978683 RepID=UPI002FE1C6C0